MEKNIEYTLYRLSKSKFRSSFHLSNKLREYTKEKGLDLIKKHAYEILEKRLKIYDELKDGKQTPYKNHPVFIAQHACACCCRGCLEKWYKIDKAKELSAEEIDFFADLIVAWIKKELTSEK